MRFTLFLLSFTLMIFSCKDEPKQNGTINIPDPTDIVIPAVPKIDKSKVNQAFMHRLVLDNPQGKTVGIKENADAEIYTESKDYYNTIVLSERSKLEYTIDGKEYSYDIPKGTISLMINPSLKDFVKEEIVFRNNKRSFDGPFITRSIPLKKLGPAPGHTTGPYELIKAQQVITGFDLAPDDEVPNEIATSGNEELKRFFKLRRYYK